MKISRMPVIRTIIKILKHYMLRFQTCRTDCDAIVKLSECDQPQAQQMAEFLNELNMPLPHSEKKLIGQIESERRRLLKRHAPLIDGTLGEGGLYDQGLTISAVCKVSKSSRQSVFMYKLIRKFKPKLILELGTNVGVSSAFQAAALKMNAQNGRLITMEASPYRLRLAKDLHRSLGLENISYVEGLFAETLAATLTELDPVDFAFIDGHHQYQPTLDYFQEIYRQTQQGALFVFDDIRWSDGMKQAWAELQKDKRFSVTVDLNAMGIGVSSQDTETIPYATEPINFPLASIL
ncbi:MAG: class I SAM-dependent methyltransferase [Phycisphaerae bacterium]|nr:class I SAM-dependent methyltransferase [Phycisphaerae bacterium]